MIDILGWGEWLAIAVLAFVVIGPRDLPVLLYKLGQMLGRLRQATSGFRQEFEGLMRLEHLRSFQEEDHDPASLSPQNVSEDQEIVRDDPLRRPQLLHRKTSKDSSVHRKKVATEQRPKQ